MPIANQPAFAATPARKAQPLAPDAGSGHQLIAAGYTAAPAHATASAHDVQTQAGTGVPSLGEASIAMEGTTAWPDAALGLGFVCLAVAWFLYLRAQPPSLDRTSMRRRPPFVDIDDVLED